MLNQTPPVAAHRLLRCLLVALALLTLAACEIVGGVEPPVTPGALPPQATASPVPAAGAPTDPTDPTDPTGAPATGAATSPPTATVQVSGSAFRIGLLDEPGDLLPYHRDAGDERITAPISELIAPSPLLVLNYGYTTTPTNVLERMPTFANGDIELRQVDVFLDPTGAITTTATDVLTTAQQIVITYRWNPELRWSDGTRVTADDSVFAYELAQRTSLGEDAERRLLLLDRYEQVDDRTTRAFLNPDLSDVNAAITTTAAINFSNSAYLATVWTPLPRHVLDGQPAAEFAESDFARQPIGYGPYMIERRSGGTIRLQRNPHYTGPQPLADLVSFSFAPDLDQLRTALLNGSLDVVAADQGDPEQLDAIDQDERAGRLAVAYVPNPIWEHLDFNLDDEWFSDVRLRQAIAHGINRQGMVDAWFNGHTNVLHSWIIPDHWAAAPPDLLLRYHYDPARARTLLDEAGFIDLDNNGVREWGIDHDSDGVPESGHPVRFTLLTTEGTPLRARIAQQFARDMAAIGLAVTVETTSTRQLYDPAGPLFRRTFGLAQFAWIAGPDPRGFELWSCTAVPSETNNWSGSNLSGWCLREANEATIEAATALDLAERRAAYMRHQRLFAANLPVLPLFQRLTVVLSNPGLRGLQPDALAPVTWNIADWSRE